MQAGTLYQKVGDVNRGSYKGRTSVLVEVKELFQEVLRGESELFEVESLADGRRAGLCFVTSDDDDGNWNCRLGCFGFVDESLDEAKDLGRGVIGE